MKPFNVFPYDSNFNFMRLRWVSLAIAALHHARRRSARWSARASTSRWTSPAASASSCASQKPVDVDDVRARLDDGRLRQRAGADLRHRQRPAGAPAGRRTGGAGRRHVGQHRRRKCARAPPRPTTRPRCCSSDVVGAAGRQGAGDQRHVRAVVRGGRLPDLHLVPLRVEVRGRGDHHHAARRASSWPAGSR